MTSPKTILAIRNLYPKKQLGQNFLYDPSIAEMIVRRSGIMMEDTVLEIGAGLGALTIPAARSANKVYAVEKDGKIFGILKAEILEAGLSNVELINKNIFHVDFKELADNISDKFIVLGNLPYNISSQALVRLIENRIYISRAVLMFQKEMARRIIAKPCSKDYGRLSVMAGYCAEIKRIAEVKSHLFYPKPKIDSEVLEIKFKEKYTQSAIDENLLFKVIKAGFSKRRKTLKNALCQSEFHINAKTAINLLEKAGIDPVRRAETLSIDEFVILSNVFKTVRNVNFINYP